MLFDAMLLAGFALGLLNDWGAITWVLLGASIVGTPLILFAVVRSSRRATAGPGDEFGRR